MTTRNAAANEPDLPRPARPCAWMRPLLCGLADGTLRGPARACAQAHVAACAPCSHALAALTVLRERLRRLPPGENAPPAPRPGALRGRYAALGLLALLFLVAGGAFALWARETLQPADPCPIDGHVDACPPDHHPGAAIPR